MTNKLSHTLQSMLRVNQAGEYGAIRIYQGQMAVLGHKPKIKKTLQHMLDQETEHLAAFNHLMVEHAIPPTLFTPLWHIGGYMMGAASALLGEKAAYACTIAVEEVIEEHYQSQLDALNHSHELEAGKFKELLQKCQAEEIEHKQISIDHGGHGAPFYPLLTRVIKGVSRLAITLSKKW